MIGPNNAFEEELYFEYLKDPESVSPEWREYFEETHGKSVHAYDKKGRNIQPSGKKAQKKEESKKEEKQPDDYNYKLSDGEELEELTTIKARISENLQPQFVQCP